MINKRSLFFGALGEAREHSGYRDHRLIDNHQCCLFRIRNKVLGCVCGSKATQCDTSSAYCSDDAVTVLAMRELLTMVTRKSLFPSTSKLHTSLSNIGSEIFQVWGANSEALYCIIVSYPQDLLQLLLRGHISQCPELWGLQCSCE